MPTDEPGLPCTVVRPMASPVGQLWFALRLLPKLALHPSSAEGTLRPDLQVRKGHLHFLQKPALQLFRRVQCLGAERPDESVYFPYQAMAYMSQVRPRLLQDSHGAAQGCFSPGCSRRLMEVLVWRALRLHLRPCAKRCQQQVRC